MVQQIRYVSAVKMPWFGWLLMPLVVVLLLVALLLFIVILLALFVLWIPFVLARMRNRRRHAKANSGFSFFQKNSGPMQKPLGNFRWTLFWGSQPLDQNERGKEIPAGLIVSDQQIGNGQIVHSLGGPASQPKV